MNTIGIYKRRSSKEKGLDSVDGIVHRQGKALQTRANAGQTR